jgi:glycosyltransferase involved in cell wall biosynthesis
MRILYVGTLPPYPGGAAISCAEILAGLAARRHSVTGVTPITAETAREGAAFDVTLPGLSIIRFRVPYFTSGQLTPEPAGYRLSIRDDLERLLPRAIEQSRPDVVLVGRETFAWSAPDIAHAHGVPVVQRLAGTVTSALIQGRYPEPLASELYARLSRIEALVTPARHLAEGVTLLGLPEVTVIPTAVDLTRFHPAPRDEALARRLSIAPDDIVVAHVSTLKPVKRPHDVLESAKLALAQDARLVYLMVGDGEMRPALEQASRELGVSDRVRFAGRQAYGDVPRYLSVADLVVMPSDAEGLARVYLETQACGRVLIASDVPAARQVVRHGHTGLLYPRGDVAALAATTLRAAHDPGLRARIGRKARQRAEESSVVQLFDAYEALLGKVADRRSSATPRG